ncbi:MAG: hypothetical protein ACD_19C00014G0015 [uncultured bacterium]|nr:MAG: hypothetical protein ACD_19C00014G0015 [uncultured bacterium]
MRQLAQINLYDNADGFSGFGPLGLNGDLGGTMASYIFQNFMSSIVGIISIIAIIWFVVILITSGISYMNAGSDQKATEAARKRITNGLIGLLITIFGIFILRFAGQIFNLPDILNLNKLIEAIQTK